MTRLYFIFLFVSPNHTPYILFLFVSPNDTPYIIFLYLLVLMTRPIFNLIRMLGCKLSYLRNEDKFNEPIDTQSMNIFLIN